MLQQVLPVAEPEVEPAQELQLLGMQPVDAGLERRPLAGLADPSIDVPLRFLHHLLDPRRVDPAVGQELLQRHLRDFAANRIERGDRDRLRGVVDDQIDPGEALEGPDVAAFPADDPPLHLIVGQGDHRHGHFRRMIGGTPLDGQGDDLPG